MSYFLFLSEVMYLLLSKLHYETHVLNDLEIFLQ